MPDRVLLKAFQAAKSDADRRRLIGLLHEVRSPFVAEQLLGDLDATKETSQREDLIAALAAQPLPAERGDLFVKGLLEIESDAAVERCAARIVADGKAFAEYGDGVKALSIGNWNGDQAVAFRLIELMSIYPQIGIHPGARPSDLARASASQFSGSDAGDLVVCGADCGRSGLVCALLRGERECFPGCVDDHLRQRVRGVSQWQESWGGQGTGELRSGLTSATGCERAGISLRFEGRNESGPAGLAVILQWTTRKEHRRW